jgi:hypothetical protein
MTSEEFKNLEIGDWVRESDEHYDIFNEHVIGGGDVCYG